MADNNGSITVKDETKVEYKNKIKKGVFSDFVGRFVLGDGANSQRK